MANRRCFRTLSRYLQSTKTLTPISQSISPSSTNALLQTTCRRSLHHFISNYSNISPRTTLINRHFCTKYSDEEDEEEDDEEDSDGEYPLEYEEETFFSKDRDTSDPAEIGYQVIGPLQGSDPVNRPYEPVFAVVQIGAHQFKVSNDDTIYVEKLKHCDINDKLLLKKVLMLGSATQTIIGRPILPDAAVYAVVEEHALDAKVIIFKKKRRKNYRRHRGHRQELTKLRIIDIQGVEKPISPKKETKEQLKSLEIEKTEPKLPVEA